MVAVLFGAGPRTLPTLAERLQASGYHTAGFCNNPLVGVINNGLRRGFDSFHLTTVVYSPRKPEKAKVTIPAIIGRLPPVGSSGNCRRA